MSQICTTLQCEHASRVLCYCCQQYLCLQHFNEHIASLVLQLNPLIDQINVITDQFNSLIRRTVTFDSYEQKQQEFYHLISVKIDKFRKIILNAHKKLEKLIHDQEPTKDDIKVLESTMNDLEKEMNRMKQIYSQIKSDPTVMNDSIKQLKKLCHQELNPSIFSTNYKTIVPPHESFRAFGVNDQFLLMHQKPNLCLLDTELNVIKRILWSEDTICKIVWCSILKRFIIIGINIVCLVDPNTMFIRTLMTDQKGKWRTGTCFKDHLFLTTNSWSSSIVEFELVPQMNVIKEWKSPITCSSDEAIDDIACNDETLAVIIRNKEQRSIHMELKSAVTLERFCSMALNISYNVNVSFHCSSLDFYGWLVADSISGRLLQITTNGNLNQVVSYDAKPIRTCLFGSNTLLVATKNRLNAHKI